MVPNILMMDCHDLGRHLGCYDQPTVSSPHLDQIAQNGIRFEHHYCAAPQCSPSRATLYTGRYAHANGMHGLAHEPFGWRLHDNEVYLAAHLQQAGYETAHLGIQHVTAFDEAAVKSLGFDHVLQGHSAAEVAESASAFIKQPHERPFFLNVGFFEPHRDQFGGFGQAPPDDRHGVRVPSYLPDTEAARQEFGALQGVIHAMDSAVGQIWAALEESGLRENTWVIFTSDHGLAMPLAKCTLYDPGIEVAMLMYCEELGLIGGKSISQLTSHVDIVPTILDAIGSPIPQEVHGESLWPLLQEQNEKSRDYVFIDKTFHTAYEPQRGIRSQRYKLILNLEVDIINVPADVQHSPIYPEVIDRITVERPQVEFYDLRKDPNEHNNLAGQPEMAEIEDALRRELLDWMQKTNDPILAGPISSPYNRRATDWLLGNTP